MQPNIWGPGAWIFLHSITLHYPDFPSMQDKKVMYDFVHLLAKILPCDICQEHFAQYLGANPVNFHLGSRYEFAKWMVNAHNSVNIQQGKPQLSMKDFEKKYTNLYKNTDKPYKTVLYYKEKFHQWRIVSVFAICLLIGVIVWAVKFK